MLQKKNTICVFVVWYVCVQEVDRLAVNNKEFKKQNAELSKNVNKLGTARGELEETQGRLKQSVERMKGTLKQFQTLNENLQKYASGNLEGYYN